VKSGTGSPAAAASVKGFRQVALHRVVPDADLAVEVSELLALDADEFADRVADDAETVVEHAEQGAFDNPQAIVGLEYEFYAADTDTGALARVPRRLLEYLGFEKELGLHNAEMSTSPQPLNAAGLAAQAAEVEAQLRAAHAPAHAEGLSLVSDGLWTLSPDGEPAGDYLTDSAVVDDVRLAANMSESARYHAMAAGGRPASPSMHLSAPHVDLQADTVMPESLVTSIQPHYQVPRATDLPRRFRYALRIAGPLLALGVNAPLFPPELYEESAGAEEILDDARKEERIWVFESVMNPADGPRKVRFPRDVESVEEAVERVVDDPVTVPMPPTGGERFDDSFAAFRQKHGTFWRWVRPVFDGASRSSANARIEFRPLPAQPTPDDVVGFQAAFAGLLEGLPHEDHPVGYLDWEVARENFYAAARDGLDADLTWVTPDGRHTTDTGRLYDDLFEQARKGLSRAGLDRVDAEEYLQPLRERVRHGMTPADWKLRRVRSELADGGSFEAAVEATQRAYLDRQARGRFEESFADWIADDVYSGP
jgi:hypothetical protein